MTRLSRKLLIVLLPLLASCITTYRDFPTTMIGEAPTSKPYDALAYHINPFPVINSGGEAALEVVFRERTPFAKTRSVNEMPAKGLYCLVNVEWRPLSLPALAFGYLSVSTLTLLPAWSTSEGYVVHYHLFKDGEEGESFSYPITRKMGLWAGLLPFVWVNLFTYSEEQAFEATAYQFFKDAAPTFRPAGR
ncbi:MAG: LIC12231 family lipoprotein [Nitrospirota bacterium]